MSHRAALGYLTRRVHQPQSGSDPRVLRSAVHSLRIRPLREGTVTRQHEQEFENRLAAVDRDARGCAIYGYCGFAVDFVAGEPVILDRINEHASFWQAIIAALQSAMFVSLGRFFDDDRNAHSAADCLSYAEHYRGIFSREALKSRKILEGLDPALAAEYVAAAWEPRESSFSGLRAELDARRQLFKERVAPIRHRVYAHSGRITGTERDKLFGALLVRELEELLVFTLQFSQALWHLYHNGREPTLAPAPSLIGEVVKAPPGPHRSTWEHLHITEDAFSFLRRMKLGPRE